MSAKGTSRWSRWCDQVGVGHKVLRDDLAGGAIDGGADGGVDDTEDWLEPVAETFHVAAGGKLLEEVEVVDTA